MKKYRFITAFLFMMLFVSAKAPEEKTTTVAEIPPKSYLSKVTPPIESQQRRLRENRFTNQYSCAEQEANISYQEVKKTANH